MPYIRRDKSNAQPNAQPVYADTETEKMLLEADFAKATGSTYYNRGFVDVVVYDDGTWEPRGTGFLPDEWAENAWVRRGSTQGFRSLVEKEL